MKRLALLLLLILAVTVRGDWRTYTPPGSVDGQGILLDVTSRAHDPQLNGFQNNKATWTHEATHCVNNDIASGLGQHVRAFYVGGGRAMVLHEPNVSLDEIDRHVIKYRNETYAHYLQQARSNDDRLDFLDEWSAYCNDVQCSKELGLPDDGGPDRAMWFCWYASGLVQAVKESDPHYADMADLTSFVTWQQARVGKLVGQAKKPAPKKPVDDYLEQADESVLIDLPSNLRQRNMGADCVRCSVCNALVLNGEPKLAKRFWERYEDPQHGETPGSLAPKLKSCGIKFTQTENGNRQFITKWVAAGYAVGVGMQVQTPRGTAGHMMNVVGFDTDNVVLMGNSDLDRNDTRPWERFLGEFDGWVVVILSGKPPKAERQ